MVVDSNGTNASVLSSPIGVCICAELGTAIPVVAIQESVSEDILYDHRHQGTAIAVEGGTVWLLDTPNHIRYSIASLDHTQTNTHQSTARAIVKRSLSVGGGRLD